MLEYYTSELLYVRELAGEFAHAHPKIARRLGMHAGEIGDPYVERLIESFSFIAARMQIKLDAEFPRFTEQLLEVVYPNYVAPTPSMAVARLYPGRMEGDLADGFRIARGAAFTSRVADGEKTPCEFRSSQDVTLYPLEIVSARLTGIPPDTPNIDRFVEGQQVRGALRLRLRTTSEAGIAELRGLDRLPVYLCGDEALASHLFELLHVAGIASITGEPEQFGMPDSPLYAVSRQAVVHEGLVPGQELLPLVGPKFHGHNLLHEFSACQSLFFFFALFCTPVINLFQKKSDPVEVPAAGSEFQLVADKLAPQDYEVFSVAGLYGQIGKTSEPLEFRPLYQTLTNDEGNHGRYFALRREQWMASGSLRRYGTRAPYIGSEAFISLVDQDEQPRAQRMPYLTFDAWLTNRDLPNLIPRDGVATSLSRCPRRCRAWA
jgi:type VI secretion system protein ImpG